MISPAIQNPIVRPFYNRGGGSGPPETIGHRLNYQASRTTPTSTLVVPNVVAQTGDVLAVSICWNAGGGQDIVDILWGGGTWTDSIEAIPFGNTVDHGAMLAVVDSLTSGTHNLAISFSVNVLDACATVTPWYGLVNGVGFDQRSQNQVPPDLAFNDGDSGLTPATTQAHELVLGVYAAILQQEFNGAFTLPLVLYNDIATGSALHPDAIKAGAGIVHAIGQYRSNYFGHTLADWAALCGTLKGI